MRLLDREELLAKLKDWQNDNLNAESIWRWALELKEAYSPSDRVVQDVVDVLAELPQDLVTVEDLSLIHI